jgi:hypothetical protein
MRNDGLHHGIHGLHQVASRVRFTRGSRFGDLAHGSNSGTLSALAGF